MVNWKSLKRLLNIEYKIITKKKINLFHYLSEINLTLTLQLILVQTLVITMFNAFLWFENFKVWIDINKRKFLICNYFKKDQGIF